MKLRDYQLDMLEAVREKMRNGEKRVVLAAPTGSGKTACAAEIIRTANRRGNRSLFIADRRALVEQTLRALNEWDVEAHPWYGGSRGAEKAHNVVATFQTWAAEKPPGDFELVIVDECHVRVGDGNDPKPQTAAAVLDHYKCWAVGLTATPFKPGMGKVWNSVVCPMTTDALIAGGYLAKPRVWTPAPINVKGLQLGSMGEWRDDDLEDRLNLVVKDVLGHFIKRVDEEFGGQCPMALVFAPSAPACEPLAKSFSDRTGERFVAISHLQNSADNERAIVDFREGRAKGLVSRDMVGRGFDAPDVRMVVMTRPFRKSLAEVVQQLGRGMRPAEGKSECLVHDHAGNFLRMGHMIDGFFRMGVHTFGTLPVKGDGTPPMKTCPECDRVLPIIVMTCPECGYQFEPTGVPTSPGEFVRWLRTVEKREDIRRCGRILLEEMGTEKFMSGLLAASKYGDPTPGLVARRAAAQYYELAGVMCGAAHFINTNPVHDRRLTALCKRAHKLWKAEQLWQRKHAVGVAS